MSLPQLPDRTGVVDQDIESLWNYLYFMREAVEAGGILLSPGEISALHIDDSEDADTTGAIPVHFRIDVANGATGTAVDVVMDHTIRVIFAWVLKTDADADVGDAVEIRNSATPIGPTMFLGRDTELGIMDTINDAQHRIAAGGTLRIHRVNGGGGSADQRCTVHILAVRVT